MIDVKISEDTLPGGYFPVTILSGEFEGYVFVVKDIRKDGERILVDYVCIEGILDTPALNERFGAFIQDYISQLFDEFVENDIAS